MKGLGTEIKSELHVYPWLLTGKRDKLGICSLLLNFWERIVLEENK
jgi:hypothetical protein